MGTEIERKFLVTDSTWQQGTPGVHIRQAYLAMGPPVAVRIRIANGQAILNIKKATLDIVRDEFEYPIPIEDAEAMLAHLCEGHLIEKTRYKVACAGKTWEVDVFDGENADLIVAELELESETETFDRPPWLGEEVSGDPRYLNTHLSRCPFKHWPK